MVETSEMKVKFSFNVPKDLPKESQDKIYEAFKVFFPLLAAVVDGIIEKAGHEAIPEDIAQKNDKPLN